MPPPTSPSDAPHRLLLLVASGDADRRERLASQLRDLTRGEAEVVAVTDAAPALDALESAWRAGQPVPMMAVDEDLPSGSGRALLLTLHRHPSAEATRKLLVAELLPPGSLNETLNAGALQGRLTVPWAPDELEALVFRTVREWALAALPTPDPTLEVPRDLPALLEAIAAARHRMLVRARELKLLKRSFFVNRGLSDDEVDQAMIAELGQALGHPHPTRIPAGTVVFREGDVVEGIWVILDGSISLVQDLDGEEVVFHSHTAGRIIGLLALATRRRMFFSCRADTDVTAWKVRFEDLDAALQTNPMLSVHFVTSLIRSLARRSRRAVDLQADVKRLNRDLAEERNQLAEALRNLKSAQTLLVESEKMAVLGQLVAGVAHELNNPLAAILRAADFIREDVQRMLEACGAEADVQAAVARGLAETPRTTREDRALRSALTRRLKDAGLAEAMLRAGVGDPDTAERLARELRGRDDRAHLARLERALNLGRAVRNLQSASGRIRGLVDSLRSYAQPDPGIQTGIDVLDGLEDTVRLFGHQLRKVEVVRDYGEVARVAANPAELNQIWTNLITNAVEAMGGEGTLILRTDAPEPGWVRVRVEDRGPGIPPDHLERIFELNFTTRKGRVDFGLGLGLAICRNLADRNRGRIEVASKPGCTVFSVWLPASDASGGRPDGNPNPQGS